MKSCSPNRSFTFAAHLITYRHFFYRESLLDPERGYRGNRVEGLDFFVEHMTFKRLPKEVFDPLGGAVAAKALRVERGYGVTKKVVTEATELASSTAEGEVNAAASDGSQTTAPSASASTNETESVAIKTENGVNECKEDAISDLQSIKSQYDLGKKWFASEDYEGFGASNVDTIQRSRKKLRAEAFGGEENLESALFNKKFTLLKDLPVILPKNRLFGKNAPRTYQPMPTVTWNLLDEKK